MGLSENDGKQITMINLAEEIVTVKDLRELLDNAPDGAVVKVAFEGAWGDAVASESDGYDAEDNTFTIGTY